MEKLKGTKWWTRAWPYWAGAMVMGLANIALLAYSGSPWAITAIFSYWGAMILQFFGAHPENWAYFQQPTHGDILINLSRVYQLTLLDLGLVAGALLGTLWGSEFRLRKIPSRKAVVSALAGGFLMGYGARLVPGCNIGALVGGIASFSLHGWVFGLFLLLGAFLGTRILIKYFV